MRLRAAEMDLMRSNMTTLQAATAKIHELEESKEDLSERMYSTQQSLAKLASSWQQHVEPEVTALGDRVTDCDARIHDLDAKLNARFAMLRRPHHSRLSCNLIVGPLDMMAGPDRS